MAEATTAAPPTGRHQRRLKNYLLDSHFQLKYSGYLVAIALVLSVSLGIILKRTSDAVIAQSQEAVTVGEQVVERGREVVDESQKVSAVVQMNIVKDPVYREQPALLAAFKADAEKQDERLVEQQRELEGQSQRLKEQSARLAHQQQTIGSALLFVLAALVIGVGFAGIVVTHKVAGPIHKMKRQIKELGGGSLQIPAPLRKGDELVDFFEAFRQAVMRLREHQQEEIAMLDRAIENLEPTATTEELKDLKLLRADMAAKLER
jgi:nitrogen fixation/metabolism regulation signal transduction histidine kinase